MTPQERESAIKDKKRELEAKLSPIDVLTVAGLHALLDQFQDDIDSDFRPGTTEPIGGNKDIYQEALDQINADPDQLEKNIRELQDDSSALINELVNANLENTKDPFGNMGRYKDQIIQNYIDQGIEKADYIPIVDYAFKAYERHLHDALNAEPWSTRLGILTNYELFKSGGLNLANYEAELLARGWTNPNVDVLFPEAQNIERLINGLTPRNLSTEAPKIRRRLDTIRNLTLTDNSGVSETERLYEYLEERYREALTNPNIFTIKNLEDRAEQQMLAEDFKEYRQFLANIKNLQTTLANVEKFVRREYRFPNEDEQNRLRELVENLREGFRFLHDTDLSPEDQDYLAAQYYSLITRAEVLAGVSTTEVGFIYTQEITDWLKTHHDYAWREAHRLYQQYTLGSGNLTDLDMADVKKYREYFANALGSINPTDPDYFEKMMALDIQLNRLQQMESGDRPEMRGRRNRAGQPEIPTQDEEIMWRTYILEMFEAGHYSELLEQMKGLIIERLNLAEESQKFGRRQEYMAFSKYLGDKDKDPRFAGNGEVEKLAIKAREMEMIRGITDFAHLFGHSNSMSSSWKGAAEHEGSNGLTLNHYDHFLQSDANEELQDDPNDADDPNDSAKVKEEKEKRRKEKKLKRELLGSKEHYQHADIMHHVVNRYIEWLRFGVLDHPEWKRIVHKADGSWRHLKPGETMANDEQYLGKGLDWKDGPLWKTKARILWRYEMQQEATRRNRDLTSFEQQEIEGLIYNITYGLGIRQYTFKDQYAFGATPGDGLGDNASWLDTEFFILHRYKTYKDAEFNPVAGMFRAPRRWIEKCLKAGIPQDDRRTSINISEMLTRMFTQTFAPLRELCAVGEAQDKFDGENIAASYDSLFEYVYLRAEDRFKKKNPHIFGKKDESPKDYTFKNHINGHEAYLKFKEKALSVPGGTTEVEKEDPHHLREKLIADLGELIKQNISQLKKNDFSVNWNHVPYLVLLFIDRMFLVYDRCDKSPSGKAALLKEIREQIMEGSNNLKHLGPREEIYGVNPNEPLAWHHELVVDEDGTRHNHHRKKYDFRDFLLNRIPRVLKEYHWSNPLSWTGKIRNTAGGIGSVRSGSTFQAKKRLFPALPGEAQWWFRPGSVAKYAYTKYRLGGLRTAFEKTKKYVYGMPPAKQKEKPDDQKQG